MRNLLIVAILLLAGCTDAQMSQVNSLGSTFKVTLYSDGTAARTWKSTGKVMTESESDGWYFTDSETKKLVRVSGCVVVEQE